MDGDADAMFEALERAYDQRVTGLITAVNNPVFDSYRADPRFQSLLQRMNLA